MAKLATAAAVTIPDTDMDDMPEEDSLPEVEERPDGSAVVDFKDTKGTKTNTGDFNENLADVIDSTELVTLATDLLEAIDRDKRARSRRDEQYRDAIDKSGLNGKGTGAPAFDGASLVTHPMMAEAAVDFAALAMKELYPPSGPVREKVYGTYSDAKQQRAKRQKATLNWQLTEQVTEYPAELEQLLMQLPLGGSQYMKFWVDQRLGRWTCQFIPIDDVFLPFNTADFYTAFRRTHRQTVSWMEYQARVDDGLYLDVVTSPSTLTDETSAAQDASDAVEGRDDPGMNEDGDVVLYETACWKKFESLEDPALSPYLVTIELSSQKVIAIYRDWDEAHEQKTQKRLQLEWMVEFGFIPWRGAYKIGLPHLIGSLSTAATGALRAILDNALVQTLPGMIGLQGQKMGGQELNISPTEITMIQGPANVDDIRKLLMPIPYNPMSPVLFQVLGFLSDAGKGVVTTAEEKIADVSGQAPVGTTLALIEQGGRVTSSIHARNHRSQARCFGIMARLNTECLDEAEVKGVLDVDAATRADFAPPLQVIPISDPNIFSEAQRYAQLQLIGALKTSAAADGVKFNNYEYYKRALQISNVPNPEALLPPLPQPQEQDAITENMKAMLGQGALTAFPKQDHVSHIASHVRFLLDPLLGDNPQAQTSSYMALVPHITQHLGFLYVQIATGVAEQAMKAAGQPVPGDSPTVGSGTQAGDGGQSPGLPPPTGPLAQAQAGKPAAGAQPDADPSQPAPPQDRPDLDAVDKAYADKSQHVHEILEGMLKPIEQALQQVYQTFGQIQQQQQAAQAASDPGAAAAAQAAMAETNRRAKRDQADEALAQGKLTEQQRATKAKEKLQAADAAAKASLAVDDHQFQRNKADHAAGIAELGLALKYGESENDVNHQAMELGMRALETAHGVTNDHAATALAASQQAQDAQAQQAQQDLAERQQAHQEQVAASQQDLGQQQQDLAARTAAPPNTGE